MATCYGLEIQDVPDGVTPLEAIVILKALDEDNQPTIYRRATIGLLPWDSIGLVTIVLDSLREEAQSGGEEEAWPADEEEFEG